MTRPSIILLVAALVMVASAWSPGVRAAEPEVVPGPPPAAAPLPAPIDAPPLAPTLTPDAPPPGVPNAAAPALVTVAAPAPAAVPVRVPIARRWWFWTALGGAALGVIVAGILLSPPQAYQGNAQPGLVTLFGN
jgi:hypothetical protein